MHTGHTVSREFLVKYVDEMNFINGEVVLRFQVARVSGVAHASERLVVGSVGNESSDGLVSSSSLKNLREDWPDEVKIVVPT